MKQKLDVAILGLGQAGTRIATVCGSHPDCNVVAVCDPRDVGKALSKAGSAFRLPATRYTSDDDLFSDHSPKAVIVAADPISMLKKATNFAKLAYKPITLWERPLGTDSDHPGSIAKTSALEHIDVVNSLPHEFVTFLAPQLRGRQGIGRVSRFSAFAAINCGLLGKSWRLLDDGPSCPLPVHFLDRIFGRLESATGQKVRAVRSVGTTIGESDGKRFEQLLRVEVKLDHAEGIITAIQYSGAGEDLLSHNSIQLLGDRGTAEVGLGSARILNKRGARLVRFTDVMPALPSRLRNAYRKLRLLLVEEDRFPDTDDTSADALALVLGLDAWIKRSTDVKGGSKGTGTTSVRDAAASLAVTNAVVRSSARGSAWQKV